MIKKLIGTGTHGKVYSIDIANKIKALKTNKEIGEYIGFNDISELDITLRLRHPYINPLLAFEINKAKYTFLYPIADGTLEKIKGKQNPLKYINQLLIGLSYIHHRDIIIADIKPSNILYFSSRDTVKYNDFGTCIFNDVVFKNSINGTLPYMPPEILLNNRIVKKSDIWSLGLTILFVLYGLTPQKRALNIIRNSKSVSTNDILNDVKSSTSYLDVLFHHVQKALNSIKDDNIRLLLENMLKVNYKERKSVDELLKMQMFDQFKTDNEEILKFYPGCSIRLEYLTYYNITTKEYENAYYVFYKVFQQIFNCFYSQFCSTRRLKFIWSVFNAIDIFNELITKRKVDQEKMSYTAIACLITSLNLVVFVDIELFKDIEIDQEKYEKIELDLLNAINYRVYRKNIYSYLLKNDKDIIDLHKLFDYATSSTFEGELSEFVSKYLSLVAAINNKSKFHRSKNYMNLNELQNGNTTKTY